MKKAKDTRQYIIEKAADLFSRYGYEGCSLSDIMKATDLQKGGIYNHFRNKDEIAIESFNYASEEVFKRFRSKLDLCKTSREKLHALIEVFISFDTNPVVGVGCPIYNMAVDSHQGHPVLRNKAREMMQMLKRYIEIKIEEGISAGEFQTDLTPSEIAVMMMVTLEGAMVYSRLSIQENTMQMVGEHVASFLDQHLVKK